jgi:ferric-dicitrate binding protein FerR (iron transport regulator)
MMKEFNEERIGKYLAGEGNEDERSAFENDLASDAELNNQFLIFQKIWENAPSGHTELWNTQSAWQKFVSSNQLENEVVKSRKLKLFWPVAAVLVVALGSFILYWYQGKTVFYSYNADSKEPVSLSDGSKVYLNKGASIKVYPFNRKKRQVELSGEAFFEVAPDSKHPFTVKSGGTMTEVVGTAFNITEEADRTKIFVNKGKVIFRSVENENAALALTAGEAAEFKDNRMQLIPNPSPNISAWHTKQLKFAKDMSLADILADASAYFHQKISLENDALKDCHISIALSYTDPEINAVLKPLASFINGKLVVNVNQCMITGGKCP